MTWKEEIKKEANDGVFLTRENFHKLRVLKESVDHLGVMKEQMTRIQRQFYEDAKKLSSELLKDARVSSDMKRLRRQEDEETPQYKKDGREVMRDMRELNDRMR
jgi:hypothetical protein|tara:strand:- start:3116 stop:3427 length:312 start_codon:yes stop_codon:yes gene_type:complete